MPDVIAITLLPAFGVSLLIFGFAPPFLLRLILLMYPRGDTRRDELMAELRARPWRQRPMWIAEQLETALLEGLPRRLREIRGHRRRGRNETVEIENGDDTVTVIEIRNTSSHVIVNGHWRNKSYVRTYYRRCNPGTAPRHIMRREDR